MRALPYVLVAETTMPGPPPTTKTQEPFTSNKHPMNASTIRWRIKTMKILETQLNQPAPKTQWIFTHYLPITKPFLLTSLLTPRTFAETRLLITYFYLTWKKNELLITYPLLGSFTFFLLVTFIITWSEVTLLTMNIHGHDVCGPPVHQKIHSYLHWDITYCNGDIEPPNNTNYHRNAK